jgi:nitroreductase
MARHDNAMTSTSSADDLAAHQPSVDWVLTTTRAVRKRLDLEREVPREVILECLRLAVQAPTGSNSQGWRWIVVTDADKRAQLADCYRAIGAPYLSAAKDQSSGDPQTDRVYQSAYYLLEHLHEVPVHVVPCVYGRPDATALGAGSLYGSIVPAIWSFQLALRSRGLGSCYTTLHLGMEQQANELLGLPDGVTQAALIPVAWTKGTDFQPVPRRPIEEITYWNSWKADG